MKYLISAIALTVVMPSAALACNPRVSEPLLVSDPEFSEATAVFESSDNNNFARLAAYETMLRVQGTSFGAVLRAGYVSEMTDIIHAATYCEVMRANGAAARVIGGPIGDHDLTAQQLENVLSYAFNLSYIERNWDQGCISNNRPPETGCNLSYFTSVRDGLITFRVDGNTGKFRRQDGVFIGTIELVYGGPTLTVPAELILQ